MEEREADNRRRLAHLRARIGAYALHAKYDSRETTAKARQVWKDHFEHEVDPDYVLAPEERARRAAAARKEYYARLAYLSAKSRAR
jgi:hypothetical protein